MILKKIKRPIKGSTLKYLFVISSKMETYRFFEKIHPLDQYLFYFELKKNLNQRFFDFLNSLNLRL